MQLRARRFGPHVRECFTNRNHDMGSARHVVHGKFTHPFFNDSMYIPFKGRWIQEYSQTHILDFQVEAPFTDSVGCAQSSPEYTGKQDRRVIIKN